MTDALFLLKHSRSGDEEIRYALRSIAENGSFIRKVWILGDRPHFLSRDTSIIEHVPHDYVARLKRFQTPVRNTFLMLLLGSLLPEISPEFLYFCDDFILLRPFSESDSRVQRFIEDMNSVQNRGKGLFKDALWRTYETLRRLGYGSLNFESHVPTRFTKKQVLEAFLDLEPFTSEDRFAGLLAQTAILNHALRHENFPVVRLAEEGRYVGFHNREFSYEEIASQTLEKTFLNFDDMAFNAPMQRYLQERFPAPCRFEQPSRSIVTTTAPPNLAQPEPASRQTILIATELGTAEHLEAMLPLMQYLVAQKHQVVLVANQLKAARALLAHLDVTVLPAPALQATAAKQDLPRTFADILLSTCFRSVAELNARAAAWLKIFECVQPDAIICEFAPTALLAARRTSARRIALGHGFTLPDAVDELPNWRPALSHSQDDLLNSESIVLDRMNQWLTSQGLATLNRVTDLYHQTDGQILATFPEIDCYAPRCAPTTRYFGSWRLETGEKPAWPKRDGPRILAYLQPFPAIITFVKQLQELPASILIACPQLSNKATTAVRGANLRVEQQPINLPAALEQCDLAIGHGSHRFASQALVAGVPQLLIPLVLEQKLTAQRICQHGAGIFASPRSLSAIITKLRALCQQSSSQTFAIPRRPFAEQAQSLEAAANLILNSARA